MKIKGQIETLKLGGPVGSIFALSSLGYYVLIVSFSVYLNYVKDYSLTFIAICLSTYILVSRLSKFFLGPIFDRFPFRKTIPACLLLSAFSFFLLELTNQQWAYLIFLPLAGIGTSSVVLLTQSFISQLDKVNQGESKVIQFAIFYVIMNLVGAIAPFISFSYIRGQSTNLFFTLSGLYTFATVIALIFLREPNKEVKVTVNIKEGMKGWGTALSNQNYLIFLFVNFLFWMFYAQLFSTLPLFLSQHLGLENKIELVFAVESMAVVLLQLIIGKIFHDRQKNKSAIALAFVVFAIAFVGFAYSDSLVGALISIIFFSLASMLFMPVSDSLNADFAKKGQFATYFGILSISAAGGDALGSLIGMNFFAYFEESDVLSKLMLFMAGGSLLSAVVVKFLIFKIELLSPIEQQELPSHDM